MILQSTPSGATLAAKRKAKEAAWAADASHRAAEETKRKEAEQATRAEQRRREEVERQRSLRPQAFKLPDDPELSRATAKLSELKLEVPRIEGRIKAQSEKLETLKNEAVSIEALSKLKEVPAAKVAAAKNAVVTESSKLEELRFDLESTRQAASMQSSIVESKRGEVQRAAVAQCQAAQKRLLPELLAALREVYRVVGTVEDIEDEAARVTGRSCMLPISPFPLRAASRGMRCDHSNEPLFFYLDMLKRSGFDVDKLISR